MELVFIPVQGIAVDIFPYIGKFGLASYDMIVIVTLPDAVDV
jgi:hypothetical protein